MLDYAVPKQEGGSDQEKRLWAHQINLASIVTLSQSDENNQTNRPCNPFCTARYAHDISQSDLEYFPNRCEAAKVFKRSPFTRFEVNSDGSYVQGAAANSERCFQWQYNEHYQSCDGRKNLLLSISNSPMSWDDSTNLCAISFHCAVIKIRQKQIHQNEKASDSVKWARSDDVFETPADDEHTEAAEDILECMSRKCCKAESMQIRAASAERMTLNHIDSRSPNDISSSETTGQWSDERLRIFLFKIGN